MDKQQFMKGFAFLVLVGFILSGAAKAADDEGANASFLIKLLDDVILWFINGVNKLVYYWISIMVTLLTNEKFNRPDVNTGNYLQMAGVLMWVIMPIVMFAILFTAIKLIFASTNPGERAAAKSQLQNLILAVIIIPLSPHIYQIIINITHQLTISLLGGQMGGSPVIGTYKTVVGDSQFSETLGSVFSSLDKADKNLIIYCCANIVSTLAICMIAIRHVVVILMSCLMPVSILLYMMDFTKSVGRKMLKYSITWAFTPVAMAMWIIVAGLLLSNLDTADDIDAGSGTLIGLGFMCMIIISPLMLTGALETMGTMLASAGMLMKGKGGVALTAAGQMMKSKSPESLITAGAMVAVKQLTTFGRGNKRVEAIAGKLKDTLGSAGTDGGDMGSGGAKLGGAAGKAAGEAAKGVGTAAGEGLDKGGDATIKAGTAASGTLVGAIVGVPMIAAGAAMKGAGIALKAGSKQLPKIGEQLGKQTGKGIGKATKKALKGGGESLKKASKFAKKASATAIKDAKNASKLAKKAGDAVEKVGKTGRGVGRASRLTNQAGKAAEQAQKSAGQAKVAGRDLVKASQNAAEVAGKAGTAGNSLAAVAKQAEKTGYAISTSAKRAEKGAEQAVKQSGKLGEKLAPHVKPSMLKKAAGAGKKMWDKSATGRSLAMGFMGKATLGLFKEADEDGSQKEGGPSNLEKLAGAASKVRSSKNSGGKKDKEPKASGDQASPGKRTGSAGRGPTRTSSGQTTSPDKRTGSAGTQTKEEGKAYKSDVNWTKSGVGRMALGFGAAAGGIGLTMMGAPQLAAAIVGAYALGTAAKAFGSGESNKAKTIGKGLGMAAGAALLMSQGLGGYAGLLIGGYALGKGFDAAEKMGLGKGLSKAGAYKGVGIGIMKVAAFKMALGFVGVGLSLGPVLPGVIIGAYAIRQAHKGMKAMGLGTDIGGRWGNTDAGKGFRQGIEKSGLVASAQQFKSTEGFGQTAGWIAGKALGIGLSLGALGVRLPFMMAMKGVNYAMTGGLGMIADMGKLGWKGGVGTFNLARGKPPQWWKTTTDTSRVLKGQAPKYERSAGSAGATGATPGATTTPPGTTTTPSPAGTTTDDVAVGEKTADKGDEAGKKDKGYDPGKDTEYDRLKQAMIYGYGRKRREKGTGEQLEEMFEDRDEKPGRGFM